MEGKGLSLAALLVALVALGVALLLLGWRLHDHLLGEARVGLEEVEERPTFCSLLPDPGPCQGKVQRWYYLPR